MYYLRAALSFVLLPFVVVYYTLKHPVGIQGDIEIRHWMYRQF